MPLRACSVQGDFSPVQCDSVFLNCCLSLARTLNSLLSIFLSVRISRMFLFFFYIRQDIIVLCGEMLCLYLSLLPKILCITFWLALFCALSLFLFSILKMIPVKKTFVLVVRISEKKLYPILQTQETKLFKC